LVIEHKWSVVWTDYMKYRATLRSYDLSEIERIVRSSTERYFDTETRRKVAVGKHRDRLVMIPYEVEGTQLTPVTIHAITRQQIKFRVQTGRFEYDQDQAELL